MHEALTIYGLAMGYDPAVVAGRYGYAIQHTDRPGFRAVGAFAATGAGGGEAAEQLVGFGYGYLIAPGQWWHDQVRAALDRRTAKTWLPGAFEVCELHVHPEHQSRGLGRQLLHALVAGADRPGGPALHPGRRHQGVPALPRRRLRRPGPRLPLPRRSAAVRHPRRPSCRCIRTSRSRRTPERALPRRAPRSRRRRRRSAPGHNGLVAACYLAREGLSVEVVESDDGPRRGGLHRRALARASASTAARART